MLQPHQIWVPPRTDNVDRAAGLIAHLGRMTKAMPPSWRSHGDCFGIHTPDGEQIGLAMPGTGIYLATDLSRLGIKKRLPHVYERSEMGWALDAARKRRWAREVMECAISSYDGIIAARAGGKADDQHFTKVSYTSVANVWSSTWQAGGLPAAGTYTAITGGAAPTHSTTGALNYSMTDPTGGDSKYLLTFGFTAAQQINVALLHDLLVGAGNIIATVNTAQTVNSTALTRYTSGVGVLMTFDVTVAIGTTASNITVNKYTNSAGTTLKTTAATAMTVSMIAQRLLPIAFGPFIALASGDVGVQSVQEVTLSAAMSAGTFALNLYKPLAYVPGVAANIYAERDSTTQIDGLTEIAQTSGNVVGCLNLYVLTNTTSTGILTGFYRSCAG